MRAPEDRSAGVLCIERTAEMRRTARQVSCALKEQPRWRRGVSILPRRPPAFIGACGGAVGVDDPDHVGDGADRSHACTTLAAIVQ